MDYRELKKINKKNAHPLPKFRDEIQRAAGHNFYAFLDLENGFWQIPIKENESEKMAFVTLLGIYKWLVMPFSLCNAPAIFQSFMKEVLKLLRPFSAGLLDDVAIWGDSIEELHTRLILVLTRFVKYRLILSTSK